MADSVLKSMFLVSFTDLNIEFWIGRSCEARLRRRELSGMFAPRVLFSRLVVGRSESRFRYGWGVLSFLFRLAAQDFVDSMREVIDIERLADESDLFVN